MVIQQQIISNVHQQKLHQFSAQAANIITLNNGGNVLGIEAEKLGLSSTLNLYSKDQKLIQENVSSLHTNTPNNIVLIENSIKKRRYNKHYPNDKVNNKTVRQQQKLHKTNHRQYVQENQQKLSKYMLNNLNENESNYNNSSEFHRDQQSNKQLEKNCLNNFQIQEQQFLAQRNQIINSADIMTSSISSVLPGMCKSFFF